MAGRQSEGALKPKNDQCLALGRALRGNRERLGLTLRQLAAKSGRCVNTLRRHEAGTMMLRVDDLEHIADAMSIDPTHLLSNAFYRDVDDQLLAEPRPRRDAIQKAIEGGLNGTAKSAE